MPPDLTGPLEVSCGLLIAGVVLALAIHVSRRSHAGREPRAAGTAAVSPVRHQAAGETAVPAAVAYPEPSAIERVPYDDGPLIGGPR
jgi:hypothetical protein